MQQETTLHGFRLKRDATIAELKSRVRLYEHVRTGAQLLSVENEDENKVFGISFRTPPADSTGIAHILEHSVLCGSEHYPVKEPFVELLKGSLQTFLNAFTYPDKTCYPVASQNRQDFYNLVAVYLDAVFYPRLTPQVLMQEGWHYELDRPEDPLRIKGVVYNEMKGAYSSPDAVLATRSQQSLYPHTPYGLDSGGDPDTIPRLTFEQFAAFHRAYYHPSNARIFFSGDDPPEERLRLLNETLQAFDRLAVNSALPEQPQFPDPVRIEHTYAASPEGQDRVMATVNWLLPSPTDIDRSLALGVLNQLLVGTPAAPLYKALTDSGLGEEVVGSGLVSELRQMFFSIGLRGMDGDRSGEMETVISETLAGLSKNGFDPDLLAATLHTVEFALRENNTGSFPCGLALMLRALAVWLYDGDPLDALAFEAPLARLKAALATTPRFFESLLDRWLRDNTHRTRVTLRPDATLRARKDAEEQQRLAALKAGFSPAELARIIEETRALKEAQERPDDPAALATIPSLQVADLDRENRTLACAGDADARPSILFHDLFTNGVLYLDVGFDLRALPVHLLPWIPLFGRALLETGTQEQDFVSFQQRIGKDTGGLHTTELLATDLATQAGRGWFMVRGKGLAPRGQALLDVLQDALRGARLDDRERLRQMVMEEKASMEAGLVPAGHRMVGRRLGASFSEAGWLAEAMHGVEALQFLRQAVSRLDTAWDGVRAELEEIRQTLFRADRMVCHVTCDGASWTAFEPRLRAFCASWEKAGAGNDTPWKTPAAPRQEGLVAPADIQFVGKALPLFAAGYAFHGSALAVGKYISTKWLWEKVRVQGGAYGGFCSFHRATGVLAFQSYRDPNLLATLDLFDQTAEHLLTADLPADEIRKSIIGAIGDLDGYQLPDAKGYSAWTRILSGDGDAARQRMREELLGTTEADFRRFGEAIRRALPLGRTAALGSENVLRKAMAERDGDWTLTPVL